MRAMVGVMAINDASGSGGERNGAMSGAEMVRAMAKAMAKAHLSSLTVRGRLIMSLMNPEVPRI